MADQTPDPTAWDDDQLDNLLDRLAERAAERDDIELPGSGASRRGVLAGLLGLGGAAAGAGVASAIGENENYSASTGEVGTDSEPLNEANVQDLHAQDAEVDSLLQTEQLTLGTARPKFRKIARVGGASGTYQITLPETLKGADRTEVQISVFYDSGANATPLLLRLNGDGSSTGNYRTTTEDGTTATGQNAIRLAEANSQFQAVSGRIRVGQVFNQAVTCELAGRPGRGAVAVSGARNVGVESLTSIEFVPDGAHGEFRAAAWFRDV